MQKDFTQWNTKKIHLNEVKGTALFHEREVWWCSLGVNIGYEQDGESELFTRPVIVFKKFNLDACLVIPLTTKEKKGTYYFSIGDVSGRSATAVLSQLRFVDRKRLVVKMAMLDGDTFEKLVDAVRKTCLPSTPP